MDDTVADHGLLAEAIARRSPSVRVVACDGWDTNGWGAAHDKGDPWLPVWTELHRIVIGPLVRPGQRGCAWCLEKWRSSATEHDRWTNTLRSDDRIAKSPSAWLSGFAAETVSELVHSGVAENCCWYLDYRDLSVGRHAFLPDPLCAVCGELPADTADRAVIVPRSRPKARLRATRIGELSELQLTDLYVDAETGVVAPPRGMSDSLLPTADAVLTEYGYQGEAGFGHGGVSRRDPREDTFQHRSLEATCDERVDANTVRRVLLYRQ